MGIYPNGPVGIVPGANGEVMNVELKKITLLKHKIRTIQSKNAAQIYSCVFKKVRIQLS
jgi:hypothetical protein